MERKISRRMESPTEVICKLGPKINPEFKSKVSPQVFAALAATLMAFGMGTVEAYTSPGLPSLKESGALGPLPGHVQSKIGSFAMFAALLSGPPIGFLIGKFGRKPILILLSIPFVTGWLLIGASYNLAMMYIGRLLTGFCAGAASLVVPIYIGEIAEDKIRGMLSSGFQLMVTLGNLFGYVLGTFVNWQWLAFGCSVFPLLGLILLLWAPASPRFLLSRGKLADATAALIWLRGANSVEDVQLELTSIQANVAMSNKEGSNKGFFGELFKMKSIKPMSICLLLLLFQQMTGIEAILFYTVHVFQQAGADLDPNICTIVVGSLQVVATFCSAVVVDKAGRRKLLIMSEAGSALSMLTLAVFFYFKEIDPTLSERMGWIPLASLASFIIFFAVGIGPVPFLMIAELNSAAMIGMASAVATTVNWTFAYLVTAVFMYVEIELGLYCCFGIFAAVSCLGVIYICIWVPETKGRSMEEIQKYFQKCKDESIQSVCKGVSSQKPIDCKG